MVCQKSAKNFKTIKDRDSVLLTVKWSSRKLKNLKSSEKPIIGRTLTWMISREKKVEDSGFRRGDPRDELTALDKGTQARVVGYLLAVKPEHGESCKLSSRHR